ncbi:exonuclease subunit SbcD [Litorilituus lipolyticus]|uniref:Nuclease SbcCD subunit D n=1 Tax=Litorilituus lipolyticus TaxID=2491017 RepID=A0A502KRQ0_9GAMM|nr:exonuclease subunit SbcD [Litorilituus lipolyticus]TPH12875.1 exonuclease subunit SbcD [Litorilituus lipolyticus]
MRFIHTSDWHLGQYFYGKNRANEHQQFLNWLIEQVQTLGIDAIIVAGDIFDTSTPPSYARELYFDFIGKIQQMNCQLIILAGNHDSVAMLGESKSLLANLSTRVITHVNVADENSNKTNEQVITLKNSNKEVTAVVCAVPFIRPRDVIASKAGQSAQDKQQTLQSAITKHYSELYKHAEQVALQHKTHENQNIPIIATGHLTALGVSLTDSKSDSVRDIYIGTLEAFSSHAFPPADYIALGHIHRAQKVGGTEHIRYSGSPIPLSFDEAKQQKSVYLVEFENSETPKISTIPIPCFQPLAMIKTSLESLVSKTQALIDSYQEELTSERKIWLDIEVQSSGYLNDLQQRIEELVLEYPVEVLLVRRSKQDRQAMLLSQGEQNKNSLAELSIEDVFNSKLAQVDWQDEDSERKARLGQLFTKIAEQSKEELTKITSVQQVNTNNTDNSPSDEKPNNKRISDESVSDASTNGARASDLNVSIEKNKQ